MADRDRREALYRPELGAVCGPAGSSGRRHGCGSGVAPAGRSRRVDHRQRRGRIDGQRPAARGPGTIVQSVLDALGTTVTLQAWPATDGDGSRHSCACARRRSSSRARSPASMPRPPGSRCASARRRDPASAPSSAVRQPDRSRPISSSAASRARSRCRYRWCCRSKASREQSTSSTGARSRAADYARDQNTGRMRASAPMTGRLTVVELQRGRRRRARRTQRGIRRAHADGRGDHRAASAAAARAGRHRRATTSPTPAWSSISARRSPIPAMTSSPRTATSSRGTDVEWEELSFSVNGIEVGRRSPAVSAAAARESAVAAAAAPLRRRLPLPAGRHASASTATTATSSSFDPVREDSALYRGHGLDRPRRRSRAIRVQAVQSGLSAPVVSNDEIQRYAPVDRRRIGRCSCSAA